jgi:hypothetical protein
MDQWSLQGRQERHRYVQEANHFSSCPLMLAIGAELGAEVEAGWPGTLVVSPVVREKGGSGVLIGGSTISCMSVFVGSMFSFMTLHCRVGNVLLLHYFVNHIRCRGSGCVPGLQSLFNSNTCPWNRQCC